MYIYCVQWNHKILVRERESAIFNSYLLTHWVYIYPESVMDLRTSILAEKCEVSIGLLFASPLYFSSLSKINSNKGRPWRYIRMKTIGALWCITRRHAQVLIYYFYDTCNLTGIYDYLYKFNLYINKTNFYLTFFFSFPFLIDIRFDVIPNIVYQCINIYKK